MTGHSLSGDGPNCFLTLQYLTAMVIAKVALILHKIVIFTRPSDKAPNATPI